MAIGIGIYVGVPSTKITIGTSDPSELLALEYTNYVEGLGGTVIDSAALLAEYQALVAAGEHELETYVFGYKFGMIKNESEQISKMIGLVKVNDAYPELEPGNVDTAAWPVYSADHIQMYVEPAGKNFVLQNNLGYGTNSFYVEVSALKQYRTSTTYTESSEPSTSGWRQAIGSTHRQATLVYNTPTGSDSEFSSNNYFLNEQAVYKTEYNRTGDTLSAKLYRNGGLIETLANMTWNNTVATAVKIQGASTATYQFRKIKIAPVQ